MPTCSADNDNVNDNDKDNDNDNDLRSSFANNDNDNVINLRAASLILLYINLMKNMVKRGKPSPIKPNTISININEDLQSWLKDDNIITEATLPEDIRCIIPGPSECGKRFILKKTNSD